MPGFNSIIVFDIETTGLPSLEFNKTKITELALLGCEIKQLKESDQLPRVLYKIVLCFNPRKLIQNGASQVSGLDNELLETAKPFDEEVASMLNEFINRLPQPVCIVAHNGDKFDFPILRRELEKVQKDLPNDVYCADSLKAFQALYPNPRLNRQMSLPSQLYPTTPQEQKTNPINKLSHKRKMRRSTEGMISSKVCRKLFEDDDENFYTDMDFLSYMDIMFSELCDTVSTCSSEQRVPKSYKLQDLFRFFHNGNVFPNCHRAEEDCKALLSCIIKCDGFLAWMNENAKPLNEIAALF